MTQIHNPTNAETLGAFIQEKIETNNVPGLSVSVDSRVA